MNVYEAEFYAFISTNFRNICLFINSYLMLHNDMTHLMMYAAFGSYITCILVMYTIDL